MFLKRLESIGFKSFAQRINIDFVPGVTAIVGPNGSGKSNITDAIRWVLGEQSARSLRGSKMEDIIFQGSESRKSLNVAEVSLILDNSDQTLPLDYKEVNIMRRVYRSGESGFYINKQACRLKDIVDLFMDSGLGREAFSIISQGKVEEILSSKAEERRTIFEEAAGVLKYKQRKRKSEFKLSETEENLYRVDDIINEIDQQIEPLQQQSKKAESYLELKKHLKEKEISLLITEIEEIHKQWEALLEQLNTEKMDEIQWKTTIQKEEAQLEKKRQAIDEIDHRVETLQARLLKVTQELEQYEGKKQVHNERQKHVKANREKLQEQQVHAEENVTKLTKQLKHESGQLSLLKEKRTKTIEKVRDLEYKLSTSKENILDEIEELKSLYIEKLNQQAALRNEKQSVEQQLNQLIIKKNKHGQEHQQLISDYEKLIEVNYTATDSLQELENQTDNKQKEIESIKRKLENSRTTYEHDQTKLYEGYQQIEKLKSRQEMLEEMKEDFQGFFQGVKTILKARDNAALEGIHGAVIELIDIPNKLITAIETVVGGQAQHIIVTDETAARSAIRYLKRTNNGRATFLPIQSIQPRKVPKSILAVIESHAGYVGIAADMVKADSYYHTIVQYVMGHVILAQTLRDANEIAKLSGHRFRVVTLEGDVVNPGGSMAGGAKQKRGSSIFTREKDLQDITKKLIEFKKQAFSFSDSVNTQKEEINEQESYLEDLEKEMHYLQEKLQTKKDYVTEQSMKLNSMTDNINLYQREHQQFSEDETHYKEQTKKLSYQLINIDKNLTDIQGEIDILTKQESEFKENEQKDQTALHTYQVTLAEQEQRVKYQQEKSISIKKNLTEAKEQYHNYTYELELLLNSNQINESEEVIHEKIKLNTNLKEELVSSIKEKRTERQKYTQEINDREIELKEQNKNYQFFIAATQKKEVTSNRLDVELDNRLSQLQTDYEITYERAREIYEKCEDKEEMIKLVKRLKTDINQLGTVNLGAIDEYERISERYTFLTEQKEDLVEAKKTLYTAIAEMDAEMERLFKETFNQIKDEFTIVFKELFGGGYAELKLTEPKDLLNTGVDIIAQPPGKKLQHLGLLSGGERALTAIGLLFSILRVRPVPFCVLDEVEAALDEANVIRFAKYVRSHSEHTQFIVITHRKGTMEEADVLYGVTMQEPGVSRLVSVRLEETHELIES